MISNNNFVAGIPVYMRDIISSNILGRPTNQEKLSDALHDAPRLKDLVNKLCDEERQVLMDLLELGGEVSWDKLVHMYKDLNGLKARLSRMGDQGIVFQKGLGARDPIIILPSLETPLRGYMETHFRPHEPVSWKTPKHLSIWPHITLVNAIHSRQIRCRSTMEPFKKGWEMLKKRLGETQDTQSIYWELVSLGCLKSSHGRVVPLDGPCKDLAANGGDFLCIWRFLETLRPFTGLEYDILTTLGMQGMKKDAFSRILFLRLLGYASAMDKAEDLADSLIDEWTKDGILQEDDTGKWIRFAPDVHTCLEKGSRETRLYEYSDEVIIQPDMEVLVPRDLDPVDLLDVGHISEIDRADVISIYRLTRSSILSALRRGWTSKQIRDFLKRISRHELPDTVVKNVEGWANGIQNAYIIQGTFIMIEQGREHLPHGLEEVMPGIFRVPGKSEDEIRESLQKRGIVVREPHQQTEETGRITWEDIIPLSPRKHTQKQHSIKQGIYPYGMVSPLPCGQDGEAIFEQALTRGASLVIFYPRMGYGQIEARQISPVDLYRRIGKVFVEAFCEDTGAGEVFDISKVRGLLRTKQG